MLAGQIEGSAVSADELFFEPELVARGSTADAPARAARLTAPQRSRRRSDRPAPWRSASIDSQDLHDFVMILHSIVECAIARRVTHVRIARRRHRLSPTAAPSRPAGGRDAPDGRWWRDAVVYQVYVRSFADANGDGIGDLAGVRARLPYLRDLGVDALWFNPWYPSPLADGGLRHRRLPRRSTRRSGRSTEAEQLIAEARALGIRTIVDIVPNHVSDQHPWFRDGARRRRPDRPSGSASGSGPARARTAS